MSLKETLSTQHWNTIPKKCKNCSKAIYTDENGEIHYQCSMYGKFKKECSLELPNRDLPKPDDILKMENK
jgi:hypothetical protein